MKQRWGTLLSRAAGIAALSAIVFAADARATTYPVKDSCSVTTSGLAVNATRRCGFTATTAGGASRFTSGTVTTSLLESSSGEVRVTRNGQTSVHSVNEGEYVRSNKLVVFAGGCGGDFIRPGDLVEVIITKTRDIPDHKDTLGAGKDWGCRHY